MVIRKYKPLDCEALAELFYNTVHRVNIKDYTKEQLDVWATGLSLIHIFKTKENRAHWDAGPGSGRRSPGLSRQRDKGLRFADG